uniref:Uncharacterized protein n=1 Tax=Hordeum vulgare subsp. vulgare TaxID=112509 RepID=A0A8I6Y566_HORVV
MDGWMGMHHHSTTFTCLASGLPEEYDPPASVSVTTPLSLLLQTSFPCPKLVIRVGMKIQPTSHPSSPLLQPSTLLVDTTENVCDQNKTGKFHCPNFFVKEDHLRLCIDRLMHTTIH